MRKKLYLCILTMILGLNLRAQVHGDNMWNLYFNEDFNGSNRGWGIDYLDKQYGNHNYQSVWRCYYNDYWPSGLTLDVNHHHVFQRSQCLFNDGVLFSDGILRISAKRINPNSTVSVECGDYELPDWSGTGHSCDNNHHYLYYYSGVVESIEKFRYGYFEIRCKTPVHRGAFPAFWLWGNGLRRYEEIDVFEYSWNITIPENNPSPELGYPYVFNTGMYYDYDEQHQQRPFANKVVRIPETTSDISQWHTFGVEWLPGRVTWYFDDKVVNEFYDPDNVPYGYMSLKANYSLDNWSLVDPWDSTTAPICFEGDTMLIDYIRVYHFNTDCDEDVVVTKVKQLNTIQSMKRSLTISPTGPMLIPSTYNKTFRAETITMTGEISVPTGAQLTLIAHPCPCWEDDDKTENNNMNYINPLKP